MSDKKEIVVKRHRPIRSLRVENITVDVFQKQNLFTKDRDFLKLNLTLNDCSADQTGINFKE